jgi:hypothetical protein
LWKKQCQDSNTKIPQNQMNEVIEALYSRTVWKTHQEMNKEMISGFSKTEQKEKKSLKRPKIWLDFSKNFFLKFFETEFPHSCFLEKAKIFLRFSKKMQIFQTFKQFLLNFSFF